MSATKTDTLDYVSEAQQWEKYQFDLNQKVKNQRDLIKKREERASHSRMKSFEQELEMKIMHKV